MLIFYSTVYMIINGRAIAKEIQQEIKQEISSIKRRKPCLAVILVGEHPPSKIYIKRKTKACEDVGILSIGRALPADINEDDLIREIDSLNLDPSVDGILVQLPLPDHIDPVKITHSIDPTKDVDGFHPLNLGKLLIGEAGGFVPCTPLGVKELLQRCSIPVEGKHAVIIGRSNIVGKPMASLLLQNTPGANATVTVVHRRSQNIEQLCSNADILIVAIGKPKFVTADMVKEGATVIDIGISRVEGLVVGDVDFDNVKDKCSHITPVPGGVGPMTIAMLLKNTLSSYKRRPQ